MTGTVAYILAYNAATSLASGINDMYFDSNGDLVIECIDGTIIKRPFMDIKKIEFKDDEDGKHLIIEYTTGEICDLGVIDPKFDISELITIGTTADEATATTPLFINIDNNSSDDSGDTGGSGNNDKQNINVATSTDLDNLWNS